MNHKAAMLGLVLVWGAGSCSVSVTSYDGAFDYISATAPVSFPYTAEIGSVTDDVSGRPETASHEIRVAVQRDLLQNNVFHDVQLTPEQGSDLRFDLTFSELSWSLNGSSKASVKARVVVTSDRGIIAQYDIVGRCDSPRNDKANECNPPRAVRDSIEQLKDLLLRDAEVVKKGVEQ